MKHLILLLSFSAFGAADKLSSETFCGLSGEDCDWKELPGPEGTICARGEPYSFFVAPGDPDKVVVDFMGGGACWNSMNCSKDSPTFVDSIGFLKEQQREGLKGIYNRKNPLNPLKNWTHVIVPYCTGDIHWGDNVNTYERYPGRPYQIAHKGAVNAKAVIDWTTKNFENPKNVFVTGCSAGAYGSIFWLPYIREFYKESRIAQFGDSGAGVVSEDFFDQSFPNWNALTNAPIWVPGLEGTEEIWKNMTLNILYKGIAQHYPTTSFSQFNSEQDQIQKFFYELMGGNPDLWGGHLQSFMSDLTRTVPSFHSFISRGDDHCILPHNFIYSLKRGNVSFLDWFTKNLNGMPFERKVP